jgi:hypothetical protein
LANFAAEEVEGLGVRLFLLSGARETEEKLRRYLVQDPSDHMEGSALLPLGTFLEGLLNPSDGNGTRRMHLEEGRKQKAGERDAQLDLYGGEDFLLLRLPSFLPLRLFWCSLSLQPSENMVYMYGTRLSSLFEQENLQSFSSEEEPFPSYRCQISGTWMYWATHFSWAQGEERVRLLGDSLAAGMSVQGGHAAQENVRKCLQEGIAGFLKQTAMPARMA